MILELACWIGISFRWQPRDEEETEMRSSTALVATIGFMLLSLSILSPVALFYYLIPFLE